MNKYIKTHWKNIVLSFVVALIIQYFAGFTRPYKAFGGEDLIPIMTIGYWIYNYFEAKESGE